jgi:hypothetical protein
MKRKQLQSKSGDLSLLDFLNFPRSFFSPSRCAYEDSRAIALTGSGPAKVKRAGRRLTGVRLAPPHSTTRWQCV